jgi:hypothetical protein
MIGYKIRKKLRQIRTWFLDHEPVFCFGCKKLVFEKDTHSAQSMYTGRVEKICPDCYAEFFGDEQP